MWVKELLPLREVVNDVAVQVSEVCGNVAIWALCVCQESLCGVDVVALKRLGY